jgi:hypothetical protein
MPNSFVAYTANGSTTTYSFAGIDDYLSTGYIKVYIDNSLQTTGYTLDTAGANENVVFATAPASGKIIKIARETPSTSAGFASNIVDFSDGSVLTAADLDKGFKGMLHIVQEGNDTGSGALPKTADGLSWDGGAKKMTNLANGESAQDAVTKAQLDAAAVFGNAPIVPQAWAFTGNGSSSDFTLSPEALNTDANMFIVEVGGILQIPTTDYTISASKISFVSGGSPAPPANGVGIRVRNFGVSRSVLSVLPNSSVTNQYLAVNAVATANIQPDAVTADKLAGSSVDSAAIQGGAVTFGKIATNAIQAANIQDLNISTSKLANNAVTTEKLGLLSVTNGVIANNAVTGDKIATNAVNFSNMNSASSGANLFADSAAADRFMKIAASGAMSLANLTTLPVGTPTQDVDFQSTTGSNGFTATNLRNPTNARDAATKAYTDAFIAVSGTLNGTSGGSITGTAAQNAFDVVDGVSTWGAGPIRFWPRPKAGFGTWVVMRFLKGTESLGGSASAGTQFGVLTSSSVANDFTPWISNTNFITSSSAAFVAWRIA